MKYLKTFCKKKKKLNLAREKFEKMYQCNNVGWWCYINTAVVIVALVDTLLHCYIATLVQIPPIHQNAHSDGSNGSKQHGTRRQIFDKANFGIKIRLGKITNFFNSRVQHFCNQYRKTSQDNQGSICGRKLKNNDKK